MKIRRVTAISIQTEEAFIIRRSGSVAEVTCKQCAARVAMVTPEEAASFLKLPVRWIYRRIEAGELHFHETEAGAVLVCLESLRKNVPRLEGKQGPENQSEENQS